MDSIPTSFDQTFPADPPKDLRLVFLIGMPRSGTTWITWLLTHHPEVVTFRHSGMFFCFEHLQKWWTRDIKFSSGTDLGEDGYEMSSSAEKLEEEELCQLLRRTGSHVFERLTREAPNARALVDQTPEHIALTPFIRKIYPEACFLHVVRDPRAVYSSIRRAADSWAAPGSFPRNPVQIARRWRDLVIKARALRETDANLFELSYEKIHAEPEAELRRMHEWIGLGTNDELVKKSVEASGIDKLRAKAKAPSGFFRRGSASGWREELKASEIKAIEHEAGAEMQEWGYELLYPSQQKKPFSVRSYDAMSKLVKKKSGGRIMRFFEGTLARTNRALELMRSD